MKLRSTATIPIAISLNLMIRLQLFALKMLRKALIISHSIIDLSKLNVHLKAEFNASNIDMHTAESALAKSRADSELF